MKKIKYLSLLLMLNLALLVSLNYKAIITYALELYPEDLRVGTKYEQGDKVKFAPEPPAYATREAIYIAYINENQELLSMFYNANDYGNSINITIGTPYSDNYYLNYKNELYGHRNDELTKIDQWILYEKSTIKEYCEKYSDEISKSKRCAELEESSENKLVYVFKEYEETMFEFKCNPQTLKYNEATTCTLSANSDIKITKIKINLNNQYLKLTDIKNSGDWQSYSNQDNSEIIFENKAGVKGAFKIMDISLTSTLNENADTLVEVTDIIYETINGEEKSIDLKSEIELVEEQQKEQENPNTKDVNIFLIISSFIIASMLIITIVKRKIKA